MRLRKARQILKCLADDTRLRILNLLRQKEINVSELCGVIGSSQSNISKHLTRLRLTGVVSDRREGVNVYYYLREPEDRAYKQLVSSVTLGLSEIETFKNDIKKLHRTKKSKKRT